MKRISSSFLPPIALDSRARTPMYQQLYEWFRRAILQGQLRPGQRVPSTRNLAAELKVSRIPVSSAYEQLQAEGYFETFVGAGTCVARSIPGNAVELDQRGSADPPRPKRRDQPENAVLPAKFPGAPWRCACRPNPGWTTWARSASVCPRSSTFPSASGPSW